MRRSSQAPLAGALISSCRSPAFSLPLSLSPRSLCVSFSSTFPSLSVSPCLSQPLSASLCRKKHTTKRTTNDKKKKKTNKQQQKNKQHTHTHTHTHTHHTQHTTNNEQQATTNHYPTHVDADPGGSANQRATSLDPPTLHNSPVKVFFMSSIGAS